MKYIYFQRIRLLKNKIAAELRINKKKDFTKSSISLVDFITPVVFDH